MIRPQPRNTEEEGLGLKRPREDCAEKQEKDLARQQVVHRGQGKEPLGAERRTREAGEAEKVIIKNKAAETTRP